MVFILVLITVIIIFYLIEQNRKPYIKEGIQQNFDFKDQTIVRQNNSNSYIRGIIKNGKLNGTCTEYIIEDERYGKRLILKGIYEDGIRKGVWYYLSSSNGLMHTITINPNGSFGICTPTIQLIGTECNDRAKDDICFLDYIIENNLISMTNIDIVRCISFYCNPGIREMKYKEYLIR